MEADQFNNAQTAAVQPARGIERSTVSTEVTKELDMLIGRFMRVSDLAEGLPDRLMGGYPPSESGEKKPYPSGLIGEIAMRIDTLKQVANALELHTDRLQRLR